MMSVPTVLRVTSPAVRAINKVLTILTSALVTVGHQVHLLKLALNTVLDLVQAAFKSGDKERLGSATAS